MQTEMRAHAGDAAAPVATPTQRPRNLRHSLSLLLATLLLGTSAAQATEYYVATTGDNTRDGLTEATALATISAAVAKLQAGDTVWILPGTYPEKVVLSNKNGNAGAWITLSGLPGQPRPVIDQSTVPSCSVWIGGDNTPSSYLHLRRLAVANCPTGHGLTAVNTHYLTIEDSEFYGNHANGIYIRDAGSGVPPCDHVNIIGNDIHHNVQENLNGALLSGFRSALYLSAALDSQVIDNTVWQNWGEGIIVGGSDAYAGRNLVRGNRVYDNFSAQIYIGHSSDNIIENNFTWSSRPEFYNPNDGGLAKGLLVADEGGEITFVGRRNIFRNNVVVGGIQGFRYGSFIGALGLHDTQVVNNTFVNSTTGIRIDSPSPDMHSGNLIANNIFISSTSSGNTAAQVTDLTGNTFSNNLWWGPTWGRIDGSGDVLADPLLVGCSGSQQDPSCYQPGQASPARQAGISLTSVSEDFLGVARPATPTLGAYEYQVGSTSISLSLGSTSIRLGSTTNALVTLTGSGSITPTGSVSFLVDGVIVGTVPLTGSGGTATASYALSGLARGVHTVTASYDGDANLAASTSVPVLLTVTAVVVSTIPALAPWGLVALCLLLLFTPTRFRRATGNTSA